MTIEQAVFSSACTDRGSGYQLLARSPGLSDSAARELTALSPSHDSLLPGRETSTNFFPLSDGSFGISRTTLAGLEYSGRGGERVHTHALNVPRDVLARFANNPFLLLRAALALGALDDVSPETQPLRPLALHGRARPWSREIQAKAAALIGVERFAQLLEVTTTSAPLAIIGGGDSECLMAGLMNALPVERRAEYSFSTGLKHSPRRDFRWIALDRDPSEQRRLERLGLRIFDCEAETADSSNFTLSR